MVAGSIFGLPKYIRISYGNLAPSFCKVAIDRLTLALKEQIEINNQ